MSKVLKWDVTVNAMIQDIGAGHILKTECQTNNRSVQVWTLEDNYTLRMSRKVQLFITDQDLPRNASYHLGTVLTKDDNEASLVYHLFQIGDLVRDDQRTS